MTTRQTIEAYFQSLERGSGWQDFLADGVEFTSYTSPVKQLAGRDAVLEATQRFYSMVRTFELRGLIAEGDRACALTRYELRTPDGRSFRSDVAELFTVRGGKIASFGIYFDTAPYPQPVAAK